MTHDIPDNSVAAGIPCRVISSLDEYYEKRKKVALSEAVERVKSFKERHGRDPLPHELREEFIYYVNKNNVDEYERKGVPVRFQLAEAYEDWLSHHGKSEFPNFQAFIEYCYANSSEQCNN